MDKSFAKFLLPAALALGLLVVLRAQNQEPTPPPAPPASGTAPTPRPARPITRPRTVVTPPPAAAAATPGAVAPAAVGQVPTGDAAAAPAAPAPAPAPAPAAPAEVESDVPPVPPPTEITEEPAADGPPAAVPADPAPAPPPAATETPRRPAPLPGTPPPAAPRSAVRSNPAAAAATPSPVVAADPNYDPEVPEIEFSESAMDIADILDKYEAFTGRSTMRDGTIQGTQLPLRSNGKMTRRQAAEYIKVFLLLNGYSIVPSDIKGVDKVIPTARGPQVEQGSSLEAVHSDPDSLPEVEQIINYVMYLKNIGAEEAARSLQTVLGQSRQNVSKITPIPAAGALIITDNLPAIRLAIALLPKIDVPSAAVVKEFFQLERADAEEVAQVLTEILAAQTKLRSQASGSTSGARAVPVNQAADQLQAGLPPGIVAQQGGAGGGGTPPPDESTVMVKAITRTNEVLVSGRPSDLTYLGDLIKELDKEANVKNLKRFQLRFIRVEDFLQIAQDAIGRGQEAIAGGGGAGGGAGGIAGGARAGGGGRAGTTGAGFQGNPAFGGGQTFNANANPRGGGGTSATGGGAGGGALNRGRSSSTGGTGQELIPSSTIVGKTLLIAEPRSNSLLVAGPPEHLTRIDEVLGEMDRRPLQVAISSVIAEITLSDDLEYGMDILRKAENVVVGGQDINWAGALNNIGDRTGIIDPGDLIDVSGFADVPGGLNLYAAMGEFFNVYIRAIESTGRAQVLSRPFIFTANNKEANISVGRRIPVPSNTQTSLDNPNSFTTNVEYEDVNLEILVTPLINSKNEVTLTITEINDGLGPERQVGNLSVPEITQQYLTTEITVPNGGIAVIGGVIQEQDDRTNRGIPWLARVPVLRGLLGNTLKGRRRSELLLFIQPRIVETSEELEGMHTDQLRRTAVGKHAQEFAKPPYDTSEIILPTDAGDIRLNDAHSLLPNQSASDTPTEELPTTLPGEKRPPAFWEKAAAESESDASTPDAKNQKPGASRLLPWNWGKKTTDNSESAATSDGR